MSRITRRRFLKACTTLTSSVTLTACTWNTPTITSRVGQNQLTIWSTPGSIDQALARWRRMNPSVSVRRQVFETQTLAEELTQLPNRITDIPDIIVADSYTLASHANLGMWRYVDASIHSTGLLPVALSHTLLDGQRLVGVPLTCNPLQVWYQSELLYDIMGIRDSEQLQTAMGNSWASFESFIRQIHRSNPVVATVSSCFDDICYPLAIDAMQRQRALIDVFEVGIELAQQQVIERAIHLGGEWFDLLKRNSIVMLVGGRWLGPAIARSWSNDTRSPWQTVAHPLGALYGPNLVAAMPIQAAHYEQASQLIYDLAHNTELQTLISSESMSVPALIEAYEVPELQQVDFIIPQRTISDTWRIRHSDSIPMLNRKDVMQLQQSKKAFYAWQQGNIHDDEIRQTIKKISSMAFSSQ